MTHDEGEDFMHYVVGDGHNELRKLEEVLEKKRLNFL